MTAVDFLVLAPVIPALPVLATWWLPWERWIPWVRFSHFIGPYLLYGAFAAWYFDLDWWAVAILSVAGLIFSGIAIGIFLDKPPRSPRDEL